ncbi:NmrA family NAD(P)-binding protein [Micromonospora sp. NPDC047738]|uniref:NmrA family NAD(P)-binding protein n=1 Tax=Micromonospora sp. NPDC047738 TaxID=3155741 RepID=UPI0033CBB733
MVAVLVTGATGRQGGAVADLLLERGHEVIAYVRSPESPAARGLSAKGARLAPGDLADAAALTKAAAAADAVFGLSVPFGAGGKEQEVAQGRLLIDVAAQLGVHLLYSSVRGADRIVNSNVAHASSKQLVEAYLRDRDLPATVLGPTYFMENTLNVAFNRLREGVLAMPLSPDKNLDQVTVLDIAGMAVHALEKPDQFVGKRIDLASDSVTGKQAAAALSDVLGRDIPYQQLPVDQVRRWAGDEVANMFQRFEDNTYFLDITALREQYPAVRWHTFAEWAKTVDWSRLLDS